MAPKFTRQGLIALVHGERSSMDLGLCKVRKRMDGVLVYGENDHLLGGIVLSKHTTDEVVEAVNSAVEAEYDEL